jgi:hypothetical protein
MRQARDRETPPALSRLPQMAMREMLPVWIAGTIYIGLAIAVLVWIVVGG